jgi:hypothetical protein
MVQSMPPTFSGILEALFSQIGSSNQQGDILGSILQFVFILMFAITMLYGQRIQAFIMLRNIDASLRRLKVLRDNARRALIDTIRSFGDSGRDPTPEVDRLLEYFWIQPTNLDPYGIVAKIEHFMNLHDERLRAEVGALAPKADRAQVVNLENLAEVGLALNTIYRIVRHFYIFGKKTMSIFIIYQLEAQLPQIIQEAEAYASGMQAFQLGQPIGDGAGSLLAAKFMYGAEKRLIAKDTLASEVSFEGRRLIVLKAEGPGANVGKIGEALTRVLEENMGRISLVIMVDAGMKLEGEETGGVSEGIGAAIGGIGVDRFKIEETATKFGVPVYAIIIKESLQDVIAPMKREIYAGVEEAVNRVRRLIRERTREGESVVLVGVGNTIGIGQ